MAKGRINDKGIIVPKNSKIMRTHDRVLLANCLRVVKYALSHYTICASRDSKKTLYRPKRPRMEEAFAAIREYVKHYQSIYELDEWTIYDLGISERLCQKLEDQGFLWVRDLVRLSAAELKGLKIGFNEIAMKDLRQRLAEIGEYLVGDPIPTAALKRWDRLIEQESRKKVAYRAES